MRRDIVIEVVGIFVLIVTVVACTGYMSHIQEKHATETHSILIKTYQLLDQDLQERRSHRATIDTRLNELQEKLGDQLDQMRSQQQLLDELAARLKLETKNRKSGRGTDVTPQ